MIHTACAVVGDLLRLLALMFQSRTRLAAENLFLRNQLACYLERNVRPHRTDNASRIMLVMLSRWWSGGHCSRLCVPTGSSGGNERPFDCSGAGNHADGVARQYPPNSSSSSPTWRRRIALWTSRLGVLHWNVTVHPTAEWTIQQFRDGLPLDGAYRVLVHDRDRIFAPAVDEAVRSMSLRVVKTPVGLPDEPSRLATLTGHLCRRRIASLPCPARWATTRLPA